MTNINKWIPIALPKSLWMYRGFILGSVKREFQARYRNSLLGASWTVLQPLAMITVYTLVFSELMRTRLPGVSDPYAYSIFLCSGLLPWGLFNEIIQRCQTVFLDNGNMIKKLNFPRICLPAIIIISSFINFSITFALFLFFLAITSHLPGVFFLAIVPLLLLQITFASGLGIIGGVLNVFFRDVGQFISIIMQFWFWFTPIIYSAETLPLAIKPWIKLNPMSPISGGYQEVFVVHRWPDWSPLIIVLVISLLLCILAISLFRYRSSEIVDEL